MRDVVLRIWRYDRAAGLKGRLDEFRLAVYPTMTVLDALFAVAREKDASVSFRCACRVGMCGSCGMLINGREGLACQTKVADVGPKITLRPLNHLPVMKDLVVDMAPFLKRYREVAPAFHGELVDIPQVVQRERRWLQETGNCIHCGACLSACSMAALHPEFLGPAALYRAAVLVSDPRDPQKLQRLAMVDREEGIWGCHGHMDCTKVCPAELPLTEAIHSLKRATVGRWLSAATEGIRARRGGGRNGTAGGDGVDGGRTSV